MTGRRGGTGRAAETVSGDGQRTAAHHTAEHGEEEHDLGLQHDLATMVSRRSLLGLLPVGATLALAACDPTVVQEVTSSASSASSAGSAATAPAGPGGAAPSGGPGGPPPDGGGEVSQDGVGEGEIPEETAGPYPADGSNGIQVLTASGIVRSDITTSFAGATGTVDGVPLTIRLKVYDLTGSVSRTLGGAAVYLWHCDAQGRYSLYSDGVTRENWLRGVQEADAEGWVEFRSIFPGCYAGRWPHVHFEVYPDLSTATSAGSKLRTTQLALPEDACTAVYALDAYDGSARNLSQITLDSDNVFGDGHALQLGTVSGDVSAGMTVTLNVPV